MTEKKSVKALREEIKILNKEKAELEKLSKLRGSGDDNVELLKSIKVNVDYLLNVEIQKKVNRKRVLEKYNLILEAHDYASVFRTEDMPKLSFAEQVVRACNQVNPSGVPFQRSSAKAVIERLFNSKD